MGHSFIRSLVRSHRSLVRSFARTAHTFACYALLAPLSSLGRSLAHLLAPELVGRWNIFVQFSRCPESSLSYMLWSSRKSCDMKALWPEIICRIEGISMALGRENVNESR